MRMRQPRFRHRQVKPRYGYNNPSGVARAADSFAKPTSSPASFSATARYVWLCLLLAAVQFSGLHGGPGSAASLKPASSNAEVTVGESGKIQREQGQHQQHDCDDGLTPLANGWPTILVIASAAGHETSADLDAGSYHLPLIRAPPYSLLS